MHSGRKIRVTMRAMARPKKIGPRAAKRDDEIKSIRMPRRLIEDIHRLRGDIEFGTYVRETVERALVAPEERAIRDVEECMQRRGVTIEMLTARKP